ncbi:MAG: ubiquinol-cytochrome c reductase iron-sulfur subunit [Gaiellaceae bacterium]|jgi:ubiquinol-cytochrome c reductase iron-sulfur subunit|nr:ubiquinol-cytochrome c reductase iron-sulfur subunit [Gaiellaceae bacterium]
MRWLVAGILLLLRRLPRSGRKAEERIVPPGAPDPRAETWALLLFLAGAGSAIAFVVVYAVDSIPHQTQFLGLTIGLSLAFIAAACTVVAKRLVVTEELEEEFPAPEHPDEQAKVEQIVRESGDRLTRRRLFKLGAGAAGGSLGLAILTPVLSLGPALDVNSFTETPWRRNRRLVDETGHPFRADDVEEETFYTAYPEGADREQLGSPLVVVRLPVDDLKLPAGRESWAPEGIVAYSKICTHAGCAIALYRKPTFAALEPKPAFVCPCHYSTFDPATGGKVLFGPAGRPLPQLPLLIGKRRELRAAGNFDSPVGPSWWGVRSRKARS